MKKLDFSSLFTKIIVKKIRIYFWTNTLTHQTRCRYIPSSYLLRYKSDTSPIIHRHITSEVDRRKYGQDTVENGENNLER